MSGTGCSLPRAPDDVHVDLRALATFAGLGDAVEALQGLARWCMRLEPGDGTPSPGASKIGGCPDMPAGSTWPGDRDTRSLFVAQVAVDDALLAFFAFQHPVEREVAGGSVVPAPAAATLARVAPRGLRQTVLERERPVTLRPELMLPTWGPHGVAMHELGLRPEDREAYVELAEALERTQGLGPPRHRLFGHPDRIRHDVLEEAAILAASAESAVEIGERWRVLLRLDSDERCGLAWPGEGTLYFCVPAADLERRQYGHAQAFTHARTL